MDTFNALKVAHILAVIVALGSNVTYAFWLRFAGRDRDLLLYTIGGVRRLDRMLATPAWGVVLLAGLGMIATGTFQFTAPGTGWLKTGLAIYVLVALLGIAVFAPALRRQLSEAERDPASPGYAAAARVTTLLAALTVLAMAFVAYLMIVKPF